FDVVGDVRKRPHAGIDGWTARPNREHLAGFYQLGIHRPDPRADLGVAGVGDVANELNVLAGRGHREEPSRSLGDVVSNVAIDGIQGMRAPHRDPTGVDDGVEHDVGLVDLLVVLQGPRRVGAVAPLEEDAGRLYAFDVVIEYLVLPAIHAEAERLGFA